MKTLFTVAALLFACAAHAQLKIPPVFSDNMVVQRGVPVNVYGTAAAGTRVGVELAGQKTMAKAGADGKWLVTLKPIADTQEPLTMTVFENGQKAAEIKNVRTGEVWFYAGDKFAARTLKEANGVELATAKLGGVEARFFAKNAEGAEMWLDAQSLENVPEIAAFFASEIAQNTKACVGIVNLSQSDGSLDAYISPANAPEPKFAELTAPYAGYSARGTVWFDSFANTDSPEAAKLAEQKTGTFIASWRKAWLNRDYFFLIMQPPSSKTAKGLEIVRASQLKIAHADPKVSVVNLADFASEDGEMLKDARLAAARTAKTAMRDALDLIKTNAYGPVFKNVKYTPRGAEIVFNTFGRKMRAAKESSGWEVKIGDVWKPAKADLVGGKRVFVNSADKADKPADIAGVRYLWKSDTKADVWLYSIDKNPATPFADEKKKSE